MNKIAIDKHNLLLEKIKSGKIKKLSSGKYIEKATGIDSRSLFFYLGNLRKLGRLNWVRQGRDRRFTFHDLSPITDKEYDEKILEPRRTEKSLDQKWEPSNPEAIKENAKEMKKPEAVEEDMIVKVSKDNCEITFSGKPDVVIQALKNLLNI